MINTLLITVINLTEQWYHQLGEQNAFQKENFKHWDQNHMV